MINETVSNSPFQKILSTVSSSRLFWILSFTILIAVAAQITIPVQPVPFTLQTMFVVLAGAFLGSKNGAYSMFLYLVIGAVGLPVFAYGSLGIATLFGPTGGYLLAFPAAAFLTGYIIEKKDSYPVVVAAMFAGNILIILSGTAFLYAFYLHNLNEAVTFGAAIFSLWMVVKMIAAASIYSGTRKAIK